MGEKRYDVEDVDRLISTATQLLINYVELDQVIIHQKEPEDRTKYPRDADGNRWYPDWWNLKEALKRFGH